MNRDSRMAVLTEIDLLVDNYHSPKLGGYSELPIGKGAVKMARKFVGVIPDWAPKPKISGVATMKSSSIVFEWRKDEHNKVIVMIGDKVGVCIVSIDGIWSGASGGKEQFKEAIDGLKELCGKEL